MLLTSNIEVHGFVDLIFIDSPLTPIYWLFFWLMKCYYVLIELHEFVDLIIYISIESTKKFVYEIQLVH